jgi:hypothetical protein
MTSKWMTESEKGQATLEFLIIVPMMLVMVSLILFAGWWSYGKLSAQNAAYSYGIWSPRVQLPLGAARLGNYQATYATLAEPIGMKPMWNDHIWKIYDADEYFFSRLGGTGIRVAISPMDISWTNFNKLWEQIGSPNSSLDMPRGTAFFYYSPFMSAYYSEKK